MDTQEHILSQVDSLFSQYGIKSITMDDIAKHLGMSKKTIYQHFEDKNDLVLTLMRSKMDLQTCTIDDCTAKADNAIHELFLTIINMVEMLSKINPTMILDLQKYYPEAWAYFRNFRENVLLQKIKDNLVWGIKEGYFRPEIDVDIISRMRVEQIELSLNQQIFPAHHFSMSQVGKELTLHFLYGICTLKGLEMVKYYEEQ
ncbi:MAG: TetR/AcrR family transcriptional regulator [Sphingobacteriaceae bacterium]